MSNNIHPTAIIDSSAQVDKDAVIEAFCIVEKNAKIGAGTTLKSHSQVLEYTTLGENNIISPYAVIGGAPQDLGYKNEPTEVIIGNNNVFREFVTVNRGTTKQDKKTIIGDSNLFMAYSHVAHDCIVGNNCVFTNMTQLAGHSTIQDHVICSAGTLVHQFVTIGARAFMAPYSVIRHDCLPGVIYEGNTAKPRILNLIGLKRAGYEGEELRNIKKTFKMLCRGKMSMTDAIEQLDGEEWAAEGFVKIMLDVAKKLSRAQGGRVSSH